MCRYIGSVTRSSKGPSVRYDKFVEGNNSAGTRVRKAMQAIKGLAQELRVEVQNQKNSEF